MSPSSRLQLTLHNLNLPQYVHRKEWLAIFNFPPLKAHFQVGFSENLRLDGQNCCLPFLGGAIQKDPQDPATMALPENFTSWLSMTHFWSPKTIGTSSTETDNLFLVPLRERHCSPQPEQNAFGGKVLGLFGICMGWCWSWEPLLLGPGFLVCSKTHPKKWKTPFLAHYNTWVKPVYALNRSKSNHKECMNEEREREREKKKKRCGKESQGTETGETKSTSQGIKPSWERPMWKIHYILQNHPHSLYLPQSLRISWLGACPFWLGKTPGRLKNAL